MSRRRFVRPLVVSLAIAAVAACGGDDGPTGLDPNVFELTLVSGGGSTGLAGTVIEEPLVAQVRRKDTGAAEQGVTISWSVVSGVAQPTRPSSVTDGSGRASTRIELGNVAGSVAAAASVPGLASVNFSPMTALPAPTIASLSVTSADPGDTIEVRVNDLPAGLPTDVLFDGVAAEITGQTAGAPAVLDVIVPPPAGVCAAASVPVEVRLRSAGVTTASSMLSVSVPADPFQVGQVLVVEGTNDVLQCALLPAGGGSAKYLLVALSAELEVAGSFQLMLGAGSVAMAAADAAPTPRRASFLGGLRAIEERLAAAGLPAARPPSGPQLFAAPAVGDRRDFWVVSDLDAVNAGQLTADAFDRVTATLEFIGGRTLLYVDDASPAPGLTQADIQAIGEIYDRRLYDADVDYFGQPTDVDGNDKVIVLLSPVVNSLTPRDAKGVIVGFFFGLDLFSPNTPSCPECAFSNGSEVLFGLVPDPTGIHSDPRSRDRVVELLPGVMVHETQHMISFRYKVFDTTLFPATEKLWLSEAMAHMAEEKGADLLDAAGDAGLADDMYSSNFNRAASYLMAPDSFSLTATDGSGTLGERGGWWMFLRWIADQYGDFILRDLTQEPERGVQNVELRTGESFFRLFADFAVAAWADDLGIPGLPERHQIPKWEFRSIVRVDPGGGGALVYALQPLAMTFATFRGDSLVQFMAATSAFYVELDAAGDTAALQLQLDAMTDAGLAILRFE